MNSPSIITFIWSNFLVIPSHLQYFLALFLVFFFICLKYNVPYVALLEEPGNYTVAVVK